MKFINYLYRKVLREPWLAISKGITLYILRKRLAKPTSAPVYTPKKNSLLYIAASVLPYHISGYTARTHELVKAIKLQGIQLVTHTRPGYPWDRKDRLLDTASNITLVESVEYLHAQGPLNNRPVLQYALQAAPVIAEIARKHQVEVIHAASNHVNALPALLAAKELGIPFQYEMRGLWELTRISRQPEFESSQAFRQGLQLESWVARYATRVFVISDQLGQYIQEHWQIPASKISLLPNCITPENFTLADPKEVEPLSLAYAGSLINYEGLDVLINALALLKNEGLILKLRIVGDGEVRANLEALVKKLGLTKSINFLGRLEPEAAREIVSKSALVVLPRQPFLVCRLVTPIKLVEALVMGKPVVVPDLPVFKDELGNQPFAHFFTSGDAHSLAEVLKKAVAQKNLSALGLQAREYAVKTRSWKKFVGQLTYD